MINPKDEWECFNRAARKGLSTEQVRGQVSKSPLLSVLNWTDAGETTWMMGTPELITKITVVLTTLSLNKKGYWRGLSSAGLHLHPVEKREASGRWQ